MAGESHIKVVVFDLGNVIFDISFDRMYGYWAERNGVSVKQLRERLVFDEVYCQFERGEIEPDTYRDYAISKLGIDMDYSEFDRGWNSIYLDVLPGIVDLVKALHSEYSLVVLTNTNAIHADAWEKRYASILQYFDLLFCSFEMGTRKPEPMIFKRMLEALGIEPGRVLFFDDKEENVAGANACGINAVRVGSSEHIIHELERRGIGSSKRNT
jgi:putative hydrolase of the HAD superfamily